MSPSLIFGATTTDSYDEVKGLNPVYVAGGAAQNAARCAQYVLPPNSTVYLGAVGKDDLADQLRAANKKEGLKEDYQVVEGVPTGACAVIITGHHRWASSKFRIAGASSRCRATMVHRSLCTQLGAAEKFSKSHLSTPAVAKAIEGAKFIYVGGFFLTHGTESALQLAEHAASTGKVRS